MRTQTAAPFWENVEVLRAISCYCIVMIHLESAWPIVLDDLRWTFLFRIGNELFVTVAGFLSVYVMLTKKKSPQAVLRDRLMRILPFYWATTIGYFLLAKLLLTSHNPSVAMLLESLFFVPYVNFPLVRPAWTLALILAFTLNVACWRSLSPTLFMIPVAVVQFGLVAANWSTDFTNPFLTLYGHPISLCLVWGGAMGFFLAQPGALDRVRAIPNLRIIGPALFAAGLVAFVVVAFSGFYKPRPLVVGVPAVAIVTGVILTELSGVSLRHPWVKAVTKLSFAIYLTHIVWTMLVDKFVELGAHGAFLIGLIVISPIMATAIGIVAHRRVELPVNRLADQLYGAWRVRTGSVKETVRSR